MSIPGITPTPKKKYTGSADEESKLYFDMSVNNTSVYGGFSVGAEEGEGSSNDQILPSIPIPLNEVQKIVIKNVNETLTDFLQKDVDVLQGGDF
jgi:hypothetical protein